MTHPSPQADVVVRRDPPLSGKENMAIDESALADAKPGDPIRIRLYQWNEPTLSLGHFQDLDQLKRDPQTANSPRLREIPWVRRKTGGGAILHDREWTYSIVVPERTDRSGKGHSDTLYRAIHESIRDGLLDSGWPASLSESCTCPTAHRGGAESFLCFQRRSPVDIVVGESKVLGSAQRRHRSGLLQHGSVLIHGSSVYPELLGLEQLRATGGIAPDWPAWIEAWIRRGLRRAVDVEC